MKQNIVERQAVVPCTDGAMFVKPVSWIHENDSETVIFDYHPIVAWSVVYEDPVIHNSFRYALPVTAVGTSEGEPFAIYYPQTDIWLLEDNGAQKGKEMMEEHLTKVFREHQERFWAREAKRQASKG